MPTRTPEPDPRHDGATALDHLKQQHEHELAVVHAHHQEELSSLRARHRAALRHVRSSPAFRLGELLVELRHRAGWRRLPGRAGDLARDVRGRLRRNSPVAGSSMLDDLEPRRPEVVLSILDEFTHACFAPEIHLAPATRRGGPEQVTDALMLFTETAWRGNDHEWSYEFSRFAEGSDLDELVAAARGAGVPSVLWNKEDPSNYDVFIEAARVFDWVFTTDSHSVANYRRDLGHDRIGVLPFAAQPRLHNPIGRPTTELRSTCFAGAWRGHKYPERAEQLTGLLSAAADVSNLVIYDREPSQVSPDARFPAEFERHISGSLPYSSMLSEYRSHAAFLNVNSVSTSPTMLSRRVFEILACRTPVVSTPSAAIDNFFGDIVPTPSTPQAQRDIIERLVNDVDHRDRVAHLGYRAVHRDHTYRHRLDTIASALELPGFEERDAPLIDAICVSQRPENLAHAVESVRRQTHPSVRLIFVTNSDAFDRSQVEDELRDLPDAAILVMPEERTLGECLNAALQICDGEYFAKFDDDDEYGSEYLADMMLATTFADASVFGKRSIHAHVKEVDQLVVRHPGHEFMPTSYVLGGTLLVRRADIGAIEFEAVVQGTDTRFLAACRNAGLQIFSTDRFNYVMNRDPRDGQHTWKISDDEFLRDSRLVSEGSNLSPAMV